LREHAVSALEARHAVFAQLNVVAREALQIVRLDLGRAVGAKYEITTPGRQFERQA
jgi:hypothetical protein